jgi:GTP-binding protein LepA
VKTDHIDEPFIKAQIISKPDYIGNIMTLCLGKRGILMNQSYLTPTRVELLFEMPLTEIVFDFYDKLKSQTVVMPPLIIIRSVTGKVISVKWISC